MAMKTRILKEILWDEPGEVVEGRLMRATPIRYKDGGTNVEYIVQRTSGGIVTFFGSSMLNKLLFRDDVGKLVCIKYEGKEGKAVAEGMSPRKIFDVQVDEESKQEVSGPIPPKAGTVDAGLLITDEDIPF